MNGKQNACYYKKQILLFNLKRGLEHHYVVLVLINIVHAIQ